MKSLRDYMNLVSLAEGGVTLPNADGTTPPGAFTGADQVALNNKMSAQAAAKPAGPASPWANDPAKDAAWKALSPEDQKWLGGADPTDKFILARAPKKGAPAPAAPAAAPAAPAAPAAAAAPAAPAAPNTTSAATGVGIPGEEAAADADFLKRQKETNAQTAADTQATAQAAAQQAANGVNTAGQNVSIKNPDGSTTNPEDGTVTPAAQAAPAGQGASPAAPANRDAMPFGKAFADAKAKGESQFTWKGKPYAVKLGDPANKTAEVAKRTGVAMNSTAGAGRGNVVPPVKESAYDEVERLVGLVHYR